VGLSDKYRVPVMRPLQSDERCWPVAHSLTEECSRFPAQRLFSNIAQVNVIISATISVNIAGGGTTIPRDFDFSILTCVEDLRRAPD